MADEVKDPIKARVSATEAYFNRTKQIDRYLLTYPPPRGKPRSIDWDHAVSAVWGRIYRGEVPEPQRQSQVEDLLCEWFDGNSMDPGESSVRKHAKIIWQEVTKGH
jgi:hypothetical protein